MIDGSCRKPAPNIPITSIAARKRTKKMIVSVIPTRGELTWFMNIAKQVAYSPPTKKYTMNRPASINLKKSYYSGNRYITHSCPKVASR